uniref:Uncharacterized protein n=1 Tax=Thermofilum pendens TaxID=2269 RepID=A0A7J3X8D7_THEPE
MPSWRLHRLHARRLLRELGVERDPGLPVEFLVDLLVDAPEEALRLVRGKLRASDRLLYLLLYEEKLRPEDPVARHDWGAWRGSWASLQAARRVAELVAGRPGRLLVDLHVSLDYLWRVGDLEAYRGWAERMGIAEEVVGYVLRSFSAGGGA